jgi:hypothetical protein
MDRTAASQFFEFASVACKDTVGTGNTKWRPARLVSTREWTGLSLRDKAIYIMAYVETIVDIIRRSKDPNRDRQLVHLDVCIATRGIEGLLSAMEQTPIEPQYPLHGQFREFSGKPARKSLPGKAVTTLGFGTHEPHFSFPPRMDPADVDPRGPKGGK